MSADDVDRIRVVHADDDPEIVELAATFLQREDDRLVVEPAESAEEALDLVEAEPVHCVISDYQLPDMDCASFADAVRSAAPGLPFILFTGRDAAQLDTELLESTVDAYLQKGSGVEQYGSLADEIVTAVADHEPVETDGGPRVDRILDVDDPDVSLEDAIDAVVDGVVVLDADGELAYWNSAVETTTGYDESALAETSPAALFVEDDRERIQAAIEHVLDGDSVRTEASVKTHSGDTIPVSIRASGLTNDGGDVVGASCVVRDRTATVEELTRQEDRLEEVVGAISHDLRNPLNVITGRLQLARETGDDDHFEALERATMGMEQLVEDLVDLARNGATVTRTERVAVATIAEAAWESVSAPDATLSVETDRNVLADRHRLQQAFEHLFENAVTHGGQDVTVTVGDCPGGFYVADDGPGIPAADSDDVFAYGESSSREANGVGLAMVRRIVQAHGWAAGITESESGGARVEITDVDEPPTTGV